MFVYKPIRGRTRRRKRLNRTLKSKSISARTYTALCYDNNGLFNQVLDSRSEEFPNNTDGFGLAALVGNEWMEYRTMSLPMHAPNVRSWLGLVNAAKPKLFMAHLRANTRSGMDPTVDHTHPYVIRGKRKTVSVVMNGYVEYTGLRENITDTQLLAERICARVNAKTEPLGKSVEHILRTTREKFRMTLAVVVTEPGKSPTHYVIRCMNWDTEPPTLYHSKRSGIYASETLYDERDWVEVPVIRF
jgi:predicted glutamine amidotransferase